MVRLRENIHYPLNGKYSKLHDFLDRAGDAKITLTFSVIEDILQVSLPPSARKHRQWWANGGHSQANAWLDAGFTVAQVDFAGGRVCFERR